MVIWVVFKGTSCMVNFILTDKLEQIICNYFIIELVIKSWFFQIKGSLKLSVWL